MGVMDILNSVMPLILGIGDTAAQFGSNVANLQDRDTAMTGLNNYTREGMGNLEGLGQTLNNAYTDNAGTTHRMLFGGPGQLTDAQKAMLNAQGIDPNKWAADNAATGIIPQAIQGYQNLWKDNAARAEQIGVQEKKDINRAFDTSRNASLASAQQRGLGSSTVMAGINRGNARERSDALARSRERDLQRQIGVDASLGGQAIGQGVGLNLTGHNVYQNAFNQQMGTYENSVLRPHDFMGQQTANRINLLGSFQNNYTPTPPSVYQGLGAANAPTPDYSQNSATPWIQGFSAPLTAATFGIFS